MLGNNLEFEPGVPPELQAGIQELLPATDLLAAYYKGRMAFSTNDLVLVVAEKDSELIDVYPRGEYVKRALKNDVARMHKIAHLSAHRVVKLPAEAEAFWLVVETKSLPLPIMCVLFTVAFKATGTVS